MTKTDALIDALRELLNIISLQQREAPDITAKNALEGEKRLVEGWIDSMFKNESERQSVLSELQGISKALDAYYAWSKLSEQRNDAISKVWEVAGMLRCQQK